MHEEVVHVAWRKSSYSAAQNECVEVALTGGDASVRDTKDRASGHFTVPAGAWQAFVSRISK